MSLSLAQPTVTAALRGWVLRVWDDPDSRSTLIGLAGVLVIHVLLWLLAPAALRFEPVVDTLRPHSNGREFNIELAPEAFAKTQPKPPEPFKFVETNPEAPENTPDKTSNFAAQNQQVAQPTPTPDGKSDRPTTEGKKDFESTQIVSGQLAKPIEHIEAVAPPLDVPPAEQVVTAPRAEQNPLPGTEKVEGDNKDGIGSSLAKRLENARAVPEKVEGARDATQDQGEMANRPAIDPKRPRPRPQVTQTIQARPAILAENKFGTANIGNVAVDAKWSNYGAYLQRMIDTVQIQWERIVIDQKANPVVGSSVTVKFVMDDEGRIARIISVETTANETASRACVSAITDRAPYGPWTDDMKAVLGNQQEMTFTFYYQ
jgi:hypothetical protein